MKTYILQKDLPDVKAGAIFELGASLDGYYLTADKTITGFNCYVYPKNFVEENSEWFIKSELLEIEKIHSEAEAFLSTTGDFVTMKMEDGFIYFKKGFNRYAFSAEYIFKKLASLI